jgi:hypothetical protein
MRVDTDKHDWFKHFPDNFEKKIKKSDCVEFDKELYDSSPSSYVVITKGLWREDGTLIKGTGPKGSIEQVTITNSEGRKYIDDEYVTEGALQFSVTCYSDEAELDTSYNEDSSYDDAWANDGRFVIIKDGETLEDVPSDLREHLRKHHDAYDLLMIPIESIFKYHKTPAETFKLTSAIEGKWFNVYYSKRTDRIIFGKSYGDDDASKTLVDAGPDTDEKNVIFLSTINIEDHPAVREMLIAKGLITKTVIKE